MYPDVDSKKKQTKSLILAESNGKKEIKKNTQKRGRVETLAEIHYLERRKKESERRRRESQEKNQKKEEEKGNRKKRGKRRAGQRTEKRKK